MLPFQLCLQRLNRPMTPGSLFEGADPAADVNADGFVNALDYDDFAEHFEAGC